MPRKKPETEIHEFPHEGAEGVEFRAERRSLRSSLHGDGRSHDHGQDSHEEGGGHGGTEMGWLVSYADMMTLLFGLFVILFSMRVEAPAGNAEKVMKDVSKQYFGGTSDVPLPSPPPIQTPQPTPETSPTPQLTPQPTAAPSPVPSPVVQATPAFDPQELESAKEKITGLEEKISKLAVKLQAAELKEKNAGKGNPPPSKDDAGARVASLETTNKKLQSQASEMEQELTAEKAEKEALQKELEKEKSRTPTQNYMATMLVWDSEKHDLDLVVQDPDGKKFDFKRRKVANHPGRFEIDSRFGPGIEMWKAENFRAGTYKAFVKMYSQNGNTNASVGHITIVTNLSTYQSPPIALKAAGEQKEIVFTVDKTGAVEFK